MNKMNEKLAHGERRRKYRPWYKTWRILLAPLYGLIVAADKVQKWMDSKLQFRLTTQNKILTNWVANKAEVYEGKLWVCREWGYNRIKARDLTGFARFRYRRFCRRFGANMYHNLTRCGWCPKGFARQDSTNDFDDEHWIEFIPVDEVPPIKFKED